MKQITYFINSLIVGWALMLPTTATAATDAQIGDVATKGITWLAGQQNTDGSWGSGDYKVAKTCFTLLKLEDHACSAGYSNPFDPLYDYSDEIIDGWKYVFNTARTLKQTPLPAQTHGGINDDPDTNGNNYGIYFFGEGGRYSYTTGICLMAMTHERDKDPLGLPCVVKMPLDRPNEGGLDFNGDTTPDTYGQIAQEAVDWLAFAQADSGGYEGGWDYDARNNSGSRADQSVSGYTVMGLAAAQARGLTVPLWVKTELNKWINHIQCSDGGAAYTDCGAANLLRTGNLIFQMTFVGDLPSTPRFDNALKYIETHWRNQNRDPGWGFNLNPAEYQAMYTLMKGLAYSQITLIDTDGDGDRDDSWYNQEPPAAPAQDFASVLVAQQNADGSWPSNCLHGDAILCSVWPWLTLRAVIPPPPEKCAILGDTSVTIGRSSDLKEGTQKPNVCSNGPLDTGASVTAEASVSALADIKLGQGTEVKEDVLTNGNLSTGAKVQIGYGDGPGDLDVDAGGSIKLLGGTLVEGECQYKDTITKGSGAGCGNEVQDPNPPFPPDFKFALPNCLVTAPAAGAPDITTPPGSDFYCLNPLAPGDYHNVSFGASNCVALAGGEYHFQSLAFGAKTQIRILGSVTAHVVDRLLFADGVQMTLADPVTADQVVYLVNGDAAASPEHRGGAKTVLYGTICGPDSAIIIGSGSTFTGSLVGKAVTVGAQVNFTAAPAPLP